MSECALTSSSTSLFPSSWPHSTPRNSPLPEKYQNRSTPHIFYWRRKVVDPGSGDAYLECLNYVLSQPKAATRKLLGRCMQGQWPCASCSPNLVRVAPASSSRAATMTSANIQRRLQQSPLHPRVPFILYLWCFVSLWRQVHRHRHNSLTTSPTFRKPRVMNVCETTGQDSRSRRASLGTQAASRTKFSMTRYLLYDMGAPGTLRYQGQTCFINVVGLATTGL
ncbi:hypothetical protein EDB85DRAFT_246071 [Lactarius pseudohatsudake]|nr:hypothetical protein EDB85DRAFT_246071 [Lactarius pseudohatsudake]